MALHTAGFSFTASNTGAGVYVTVPGVTDQYLTLNANNRFIIPQGRNGGQAVNTIAGGIVLGSTTTLARINNATLRAIGLPSLSPVNQSLATLSLINVPMGGRHGPKLPIADEFGIECDATSAVQNTGFLWLTDGNMNVSPNPIYTLQASATITAVANVWTNGTFAFTQTLPVGQYDVVGMDVVGTACIAGRLAFADGGPRPGVLARSSHAVLPSNQFRFGNLGTFGTFTSYAQPTFDIFASAAGAVTVTMFLDVIKTV